MTIKEAQKLKAGDKVKVILGNGQTLPEGRTCTVINVDDRYVYIKEGPLAQNGWWAERFEVIKQERDKKGRFTSKDALNKPQTFKKGALYAVKRKRGVTVANLRAIAHEDFLVFSSPRDKKTFLARKKQVGLLNEQEVKQYLESIK